MTSKNNPDARRRGDGWVCPGCNTYNDPEWSTCAGTKHTRLVHPKPDKRGWKTIMEHTPCGAAR